MQNLIKELSKLLKDKKLTLSAAESCTGGLLSHMLTNVPGSSRYFKGCIVAYENSAKIKLLGISKSSLDTNGAVSPETALTMAKQVKKNFSSDLGIGITGVAGPTGGTKEKSVGTVYISVCISSCCKVKLFHYKGSRIQNKKSAVKSALILLIKEASKV